MNEVPVSEQSSRESRRRAIEQAGQARQRRRVRLAVWGGAIVVIAGAGIGIAIGVFGGGNGGGSGAAGAVSPAADYRPLSTLGTLTAAPAPGALGPEGVPVPNVPLIAGTSAAVTGQAVDQISCETSEQTVFHIHTHLTIFVNGQQRQVPAAIGIPGAVVQPTNAGPFIGSGTCFYFLHTHATDGIIHIESPAQRTYTLGEFFDEWGQTLGPDRVGSANGTVTAIVNGKVFKGNPRSAPLGSNENLQLEVGRPLVAPETINWAKTGL